MNASKPVYQVDQVDCSGDRVEIRWHDGHVSRYPGIWLLEACLCAACGDTRTAVRHVRLVDKPARPRAHSCRIENRQLIVDWGDAHVSTYALDWLRHHCPSDAARAARKFQAVTWGSEMAADLPCLSYPEVAAAEDRQLDLLETILYRGFAILRDVPGARERTEEVAALVGKLRMTNYAIYELESKPDPEISADLALPLAPHTDEPYRIDPPGITFFHVIVQADDGGASTLLDSFNLARLLREQNPAAYEILTRIPAHFHRHLAEGRRFACQHPIIQTDGDGDLVAVRLLDRGLAPVDCAPDEVEAFYDALRELLSLSYRGAGAIEFKLRNGEALVFNNQRVMHGRTAFDPTLSKRHIRSASVDLDEFYSRLRVLWRARQDPRCWMTLRRT